MSIMRRMSESRGAKETEYERKVKPFFDKVLSLTGLVLLSPLFGLISLAIFLDNPGPVFFTQKRIGKDGSFFRLHKFRSMRMDAPHDVPTHLLVNPEEYLTRVGKILRRTSLDELPQLWDIFRGKMSVVGPRPALWNQDDLMAERRRYRAVGVLPGLTGLAQVRGRDELEIPDKARLDGIYAQTLRRGGLAAFIMDAAIFLETITSVLRHDGVAEGTSGESYEKWLQVTGLDSKESEEFGYKKRFRISRNVLRKKKILITGAESYVGGSFEEYAKEYYADCLETHSIGMKDDAWRKQDFSQYDAVFHVAGIAHVDMEKISEKAKRKYYEVNTDLAIETAQKAKESGVGQFIFMSSMTIYGDSVLYGKKVIDEHTVPAPSGIYADSKWRADRGVRSLAEKSFHVAVIRSPMIYGKGSKGNYPVLAKVARWIPVFPKRGNKRSVIYIENLCEFVCLLTLSGEGGVYFPQNREYVSTAGFVREIGRVSGNRVHTSIILEPAVLLAVRMPGKIGRLARKAFGSVCYSRKLSQYEGLNYQLVDFRTSIERTEGTRS